MKVMRMIVGLGNPGKKYENTRHNIGFMVLDKLAEGFSYIKKFEAEMVQQDDVLYVKPQTFMNRSGEAVSRIAGFYKVDADKIYVVHDDLDIRLGEYKLQKGKGPKEHKGLKSIEGRLGTKEFWRVRVGVDNREPENRVVGENYVLQQIADDEEDEFRGVIGQVVERMRENVLS